MHKLAETINKLRFTFKQILRDNSVTTTEMFRAKTELTLIKEAQIKILGAEPLGGVSVQTEAKNTIQSVNKDSMMQYNLIRVGENG